MQYALKIVFSTAILIAVAELAKRGSFWAAALASLPLTSLLAFVCVPFREIAFPKDGPGVFELIDHEGQMHTIPLHRVRSAYKNDLASGLARVNKAYKAAVSKNCRNRLIAGSCACRHKPS